MFAIEARGLTKRFGKRCVVRQLDLTVPSGIVYGFLGPNGAGKTTAMRMLLGLIRPDEGEVTLLGRSLAKERMNALREVGAFIESASLYDHLTGRANLEITRGLLGCPASEIDRVLEVVGLTSAGKSRAGTYSLGMKQRLALARSLLGSPRLLLLDEPTNGLDPDGIVAMRSLIRDLPKQINGTVLVSSHLLGEVEQMATTVGLLKEGRLLLQADLHALTRGAGHLRVELDDTARGEAALSDLPNRGVERLEGALRLRCPDRTDPRQFSANVNRLLVEAGLAVSGLATEVRTLEQVYRDLVGDDSNADQERITA